MKIKSLILSLLLGSSIIAQTPSYIPKNELIGWWPFNGNAYDESGNGNNGTVNGATLTTGHDGTSNSAYKFNGMTNYIKVKNNSSLNIQTGQSLSLSFWVKHDISSTNIDKYIISKYSGNINTSSAFACGTGWQGNAYTMQQVNAGLSNHKELRGSKTINDGNWHHFVSIWENGVQTTIYIDNIKDITQTWVLSGSIINDLDFYFGCGANLAQFYKGNIDEIGIWNRALAQEEITALFKSCTNPIASIAPQSSTTVCEGNSVTLNASTGVGYSYEWFSNNSLINNAYSSSYTSNISGNYTVKVIDGTCSTTSTITSVTVNPNPIVSLASLNAFINNNSNEITLVGNPSGGTYIGSGISGSSFNPKLAGLGNKTITYNYTNSNNCSGSATRSTIVFDTTGIVCTSTKNDTVTTHISVTDTLIIKAHFAGLNNIIGTTEIKIYPNPTSDIIYINTGDFTQLSGSTIKITDALGKSVFSSLINQQLFTINTSQFGARGVYTVQIIDGKQIVKDTRKIVLQ